MPLRNTAEAYGSLARFLHWAIVLLIVPQYFIAEAAEELPKGLERLQLMDWHKSLGMLVLLLTLARIGWKIVNRGLPGPIGKPWQRKAAAAGRPALPAGARPADFGWAMSSAADFRDPLRLVPVSRAGRRNHDLHAAG
jgi:cytochrome b561